MLLTGQPLRRPLIGIALSLTAGIYLASRGWLHIGYAIPLAAAMLLMGLFMFRTRLAVLPLFAAIALVSAIRFLVCDPALAGNSIIKRQGSLPQQGVELIGRVCGEPTFHTFRNSERGMWVFPLRLEGVNDAGAWKTSRGEVDVRVMGGMPAEPVALNGQRIWVRGELQRRTFRGGNPIGLKVSWPRYCKGLSKPRFSPMNWCRRWRQTAAGRLAAGMEHKPLQLAVLRSLVLGYRNEIPAETYSCFRRTGSLHIFAISGLHVGIIGLLLVIVLKSVGVSRDRFGLWLIPMLFVYVAATGMKASALRAMVMAGVFLLAPLFRRRPDIPSSVAFAALLLLLLDPRELQSAGFVFSFVVVAFIVMVYTAVPEHWLAGNWLRNYAVSLAITSFAASLASIPMTAYYFGRFSPIALVGNLAVVPLTFCIVLSGWLSILISPASAIFNHASVVFINLMLWSVRGLDRIPGSSIKAEAPPVGALLLWYGGLIYLLVHARRRRQRLFGLAGVCVSVLWALLA